APYPCRRPSEGRVAGGRRAGGRVLRLSDRGGVALPAAPAAAREVRATRPLQVVQPQGVGFEVHGHEVAWQNWRFRYGLLPREGLVLYTVGYEDGGTVRPVLYRASLSEMLVPYADPGAAWSFRT